MKISTNVVRLRQPDEFDDPLTEVLRTGARRLLAQAVEMEAEAFLSAMQDLRLPDGRARLVRHGHGPEREIQTGIGPMPVARVRIRDRGASRPQDRIRFSSTLLPKWGRRTRSLDTLLPVLYLRGVSNGDFLAHDGQPVALVHRDDPSAGKLQVTAQRPPGSIGVTGDGTVFSLVFTAKAKGSGNVSISMPGARNSQNQPLEVLGSQATVTVN